MGLVGGEVKVLDKNRGEPAVYFNHTWMNTELYKAFGQYLNK